MSDRAAVVLALAAAAGAWWARPLPVAIGVGLAFAALAARRPWLLCLAAALAASGLSARSWAGLEPPPPGPVRATATLVSDPEAARGAVRVELRLGRRRVQAFARGTAASALRRRLAGERLEVSGRLGVVPPRSRSYLARRHVAARLEVESVGRWWAGDPVSRVANEVRRTLLRGTSSLPDEQRALFTGFVLGDDRDQSAEARDDFRAAGLTHLLAVSGENVAFVLVVAAPLLRRLRLRPRLVVGTAVLVFFGVLTRWEPSVLRAIAMAGIAMAATTWGRPVSTVRLLALAVAGLLLVDPLLVGSVGFLLSVGACAGIALLAGPLAGRLPGPHWLRAPLSVTLAAQVGVAPVLVRVFGGVPVASVPANLLAVPAAGPVMVWGLVAGLPAGLLGEPGAGILHLPTRALVGWIAAVAGWAAGLPLGQLGAAHVVALAALGLALVRWPDRRRAAGLAMVFVALLPAVSALGGRRPPADGVAVAGGAQLWRSGSAVVLVVDDPDPGQLMAGLRRRDVRRVDLLVVRGGGVTAARSLAPVLARVPTRAVLAPPGHHLGRAITAEVGERARVGNLVVEVDAVRPHLRVRVSTSPGISAPDAR